MGTNLGSPVFNIHSPFNASTKNKLTPKCRLKNVEKGNKNRAICEHLQLPLQRGSKEGCKFTVPKRGVWQVRRGPNHPTKHGFVHPKKWNSSFKRANFLQIKLDWNSFNTYFNSWVCFTFTKWMFFWTKVRTSRLCSRKIVRTPRPHRLMNFQR